MHWQPPFNPMTILALVAGAAALMALSYLPARKQLKVSPGKLLVTVGLRGAALLLLMLMLFAPARLPSPQTVTTKRTLAVLIDTSGSMSRKDGSDADEPTRLALAVKALTDSDVAGKVSAVAKLAVYRFDGLPASTAADALGGLEAQGGQTDLAAAMEQVARQHQSDDLAGLLVLTDGRNTQGGDPLAAGKRVRVPVFAVPVGKVWRPEAVATTAKKDLSIDAVTSPPRLILGRSAQVVATVSAVGYGPRQVAVELVESDRPVSTSAVSVSETQTKRQALFTVTPGSVGKKTYQVRIAGEADEADPTNNLRTFELEVVDPVNRLLYIDWLRNERRFLKRVIDTQRNLRFAAVVQMDEGRVNVQGNDEQLQKQAASLDAAQLMALKAIIIGDLPAETFSEEQIANLAAWVDRGGALLLLGGPKSLGDVGFMSTPLAKLLPVSVGAEAYQEKALKVVMTPQGAAHPAFQRVAKAWAPSAPLLSYIAVTEVKPAATVLISGADSPQAPVLVSHQFGHGKVAVALTDSTWRWQLAAEASSRGESEHAIFWRQIIDWLLPQPEQKSDEGGAVQIITDRLTYDIHEAVTMMASVRGADGQVRKDAEVQFRVAAPDGRPIERKGEIQDQAYVATFDAYAAGSYQIQVVASAGGRSLGSDEATVTVQQPLAEFAEVDPDPELLRQLTEATGGQVLEPKQLAELVDIMKLQPREVQIQPNAEQDAEPVWNHWALLVAFVLLMSGEWLIRRRNQWV